MEAFKPVLISISGPTASGKTDYAISLAQALKTEILSADSRQIYREMSVGTAKPSPADLAKVKHHFIDHCSIHDQYNAGIFEKEALQLLETLFRKYPAVIITGGTGLYLKAVYEGFDPLPQADKQLRQSLQTLYQSEGVQALFERLKQLDPEGSRTVDPQNPQRLIRAIELVMSGKSLSDLKTGTGKNRPFRLIKIQMDVDRETLYHRINQRTLHMLEQGWLAEAEKLLPFAHLNALNTVGYKELFGYLKGETGYDETVRSIQQHTRNYAKRQLTWLRQSGEHIPHLQFDVQKFIREQPPF